MKNENSKENSKVVIGYYPLRNKAQICRLLCQFLEVPYKDLFFTPQTWEHYKHLEAANWLFADLPFLDDAGYVVTQTYPICLYLIHKAGRKDLLGRNLEDQTKIDQFIWKSNITQQLYGAVVSLSQKCENQLKTALQQYFEKQLRHKIHKIQEVCCEQNYFLGYLSLADFHIYQIVFVIRYLLERDLKEEFPKLTHIHFSIFNIEQIKKFEEKISKQIKICPVEFCKKWKGRCTSCY